MVQENHNVKTKQWVQINEQTRYKIEGWLESNIKPAEIAKLLGYDRRTIEREISRGMVEMKRSDLSYYQKYCADVAQRVHDERGSNKGRKLKIGHDHRLAKHIENKIRTENYSPDAVIGEIKQLGMQFETSICTKTLYNYIDQNVFLGISNQDLVVKRKKKKRKPRRVRKVALNNLKCRSIEERPEQIDTREEIGHWEMDCVVGSKKAVLLVLTERNSRKEMLFKLPAKTQVCVIQVINRLEKKYRNRFSQIFKSITMDNGSEFLDQASIESSCMKEGTTRTVCYYAHPYSSWERGSNEVNNKLIRRFIPKGSKIEQFSAKEIKRIEHWMNNYPRRIFGYKTSNQMFQQLLA